VRVAVVQVGYTDEEPVADRVARVADLVRAQAGADLVVLPELWPHGGFSYRTWAERAEPVDGPTTAAMAAAARDAGVVLHAGSLVERASAGADQGPQGRGLWNTAVVLGPDGGVLATYRKVHRFGFGRGEPVLMEAGEEVVAVEVPMPATGGSAVLGLATCYDLRFPELFRALLDRGATTFVVPAAWPAARVEHWDVLLRARALEDQAVVVGCGTAGTHAGVEMGGCSAVVGVRGEVLARAGRDEEVLQVEVDLTAVARWREEFPVLADRRLGRDRPGREAPPTLEE